MMAPYHSYPPVGPDKGLYFRVGCGLRACARSEMRPSLPARLAGPPLGAGVRQLWASTEALLWAGLIASELEANALTGYGPECRHFAGGRHSNLSSLRCLGSPDLCPFGPDLTVIDVRNFPLLSPSTESCGEKQAKRGLTELSGVPAYNPNYEGFTCRRGMTPHRQVFHSPPDNYRLGFHPATMETIKNFPDLESLRGLHTWYNQHN